MSEERSPDADLAELARIRALLRGVPDPLGMLEGIVAFAPFAVQVYRADGRSLFVNRAFRELFQSEPPPDYNLFKDEVVAESGLLPLVRRAFAGETVRAPPVWYDPRALEHVKVADARRIAVETWIVPLVAHGAEVTHVAVIGKDLSAELNARAAAEREAELRRLAEQSRERVVRLQQVTSALATVLDDSEVGRVLLELALPALGAERGAVHLLTEDRRLLELLAARGFDDSGLSTLRALEVTLAPFCFEATSRAQECVEGRAFGLERAAALPLVTAGAPFGVLSIELDAGRSLDADEREFALALARQGAQALERARLYKEAECSAQRATEASRAKDEFLSVLSHELRTPLNAVYGWAQLMRSQRDEDPSLIDRGIDVILRNARAQVTIIDDILDMARIITGKLRLTMRGVDLGEIVLAAFETVQPSASAKKIKLTVDHLERCTVLADVDRIQQVAWNLLSNAVKFTAERGSISVRLECTGSRAVLTVQDTGEGIAATDLPFIFDRFRQADSSITRAKGGLGLGLAIVRQLVEAHGGSVTAHSGGRGSGASFRVELPVLQPATATDTPATVSAEAESALSPLPEPQLSGIRVAIVDDERDSADLLGALLSVKGAEVRVAYSAAEGRTLARVFLPHVLVSDLGMPGENGIEFLKRLRTEERPPLAAIPAIALTAYVGPEHAARALQAGFQLHLPKPFDPDSVVRAVLEAARQPCAATGS